MPPYTYKYIAKGIELSQIQQATGPNPMDTVPAKAHKAFTVQVTVRDAQRPPHIASAIRTVQVAVSQRTAFQCGDRTTQVGCTARELERDPPAPCPPGRDFAMTDILQAQGVRTIYKRCVEEATCAQLWYHETEDRAECLDLEAQDLSRNLACHFCCTRDHCNAGIIPDCATLYSPP